MKKTLTDKQKKVLKILAYILGATSITALIYFLLKNKAALKQYKILLDKANLEIEELKALCLEKDSFFEEAISDGLRHGSPLCAKHMAEKNWYLKGLYVA